MIASFWKVSNFFLRLGVISEEGKEAAGNRDENMLHQKLEEVTEEKCCIEPEVQVKRSSEIYSVHIHTYLNILILHILKWIRVTRGGVILYVQQYMCITI